MSHLYHIPRENGLNHHISHPVAAVIGAVLGLFGMLASAAKLVIPWAVVNLEPAYQVLGFAAAMCVTAYNLYCMKQIMDARTAKQIADIAAGKAARAVAAK